MTAGAPAIVFRADASPASGGGHVMRCLALAEALAAAGAAAHFACADCPPSLVERLVSAGMAVHRVPAAAGSPDDLAALQAIVRAVGAAAVVVDGYGFGPRWRAGLAATGPLVVALDDLGGDEPLLADIVLNPAPSARADSYTASAPEARLLLGPRYALLRREFREALDRPRLPVAERASILVTFGASDPLGLTVPCTAGIASALRSTVPVDVVLGGLNPRMDAAAGDLERLGAPVTVHRDSRHMATLMAAAGLAVSAGGGTAGELAALGVPTLLVVVADNQAAGSTAAAALDWCDMVDARGRDPVPVIIDRCVRLWQDGERRKRLATLGPTIVDGRGAERVAAAILGMLSGVFTA